MIAGATTYWSNNGKHQNLVNALQALIPTEGPVEKQHKNGKLETFRKAQNCYYDLYNNGLCNRARSFSKVFGIASGEYKMYGNRGFGGNMYRLVEDRMNEIILAAAKEQGLMMEEPVAA